MDDISFTPILAECASDDSFDPWKIAIARFLESLDEKSRENFNEATPGNLFYCVSKVEREDREAIKARSAIRQIYPLISAVKDYGKALDVYANLASPYLAPIWGSIRVVLVIASSHAKFYSRILDVFSRIGDILPRFRDYQRIFNGKKHQRFTLSMSKAYLDIITLCTEFSTLLQGQNKSFLKRIYKPLSPALNSRLEKAVVDKFRKHKKEVDKEAEVCHMIEEKEARDLVLRISAAAEARERGRLKHILIYDLNSNVEQRQSKKNSSYDCLQSTMNTNITRCNGYDMQAVVLGLLSCRISKLGWKMVPLQCSAVMEYQLLRSLNDLPTTVFSTLETLLRDGKKPDIENLIRLIEFSIQRLPSVIMFVDGLDEMSESDRKFVFLLLKTTTGLGATSQVKDFVSSREDATYLMDSPGIPSFKIQISSNTISPDIDRYIKNEIEALRSKGDLVIRDATLEDEIATALVNGAKGMFLWVKFQLADLCTAETDKSIRDVLKNIPRSLSETYDRLLGRIERQEYVKRMFNWILSKVPNNIARLIRACGNLVVIDDVTLNVSLAHYTVEQYLLGQDGPEATYFHIQLQDARIQVGQFCVTYLSFSDFETQVSQYCPGQDSFSIVAKYPSYVCCESNS
ncbi:hypothetical protein LCER1_G001100 [Lachnellula cervina]|uniref:Vegetative incompatibility protein HET-E-1 n=1 Tax=Lachnellula cervina TaxID=1316786 RepID=A0A7D8YS78_9HELO|nr:hypothetical protein LCER1_G001100 [Lachnellula cervina]